MRDLAIAVRVGSPDTNFSVVKAFIDSLFKNLGDCDWCLFISIGNIDNKIIDYLSDLQLSNPLRINIFQKGQYYWSEFINEAIKLSNNFHWFIKSHDDIELLTPNFFNVIDESIKKNENAGWISFTDAGYIDGYWCPPTRPGYHIDFLYNDLWNSKQMFQYHSLELGWHRRNFYKKVQRFVVGNKNILERSQLDFPEYPVRCHAPWNMFVMIRMSTLIKIGKCESWGTYNALFVDEDWGLAAMLRGYRNIYIPNIEYYHHRPNVFIGGNRSQHQAKKDNERVSGLFRSKWGFYPNPGKDGLSNVPKVLQWSATRSSFDWDFNII